MTSLSALVGLSALGLVLGAFGTMVGAGGGFLLMPLLLLVYPGDSPGTLTSISLGVVFLNAASGTWGYRRLRRIDYRAGLSFAAATVPAGLVGVAVTYRLPRHVFDVVLGLVVTAVAVYLLAAPEPKPLKLLRPNTQVVLTDADDNRYEYGYHRALGMGYSVIVGFVATLLGIGGGSIHVAGMISLLGFPVHVATATSHFVLALTTFAATVAHLLTGQLAEGWHRLLVLGGSAVVGAQVGARLARHAPSRLILRLLALSLLVVGARLAVGALS